LIKELYRKDFYFIQIFKARDIDMGAFGDVQKDSIEEEKEGFNVQILTPRKAQIKEKF